jgi:predicted TIM-barrel fold metal-dependent hydrolase
MALKYFDSLVHVTEDGTWLGGTRYDASEDRLIRELDACGPDTRACLVAIAGHASNEAVQNVARKHPGRFIPVGSIDPGGCADPVEVDRKVGALARQGFLGLKLHPRLNGYDPLHDHSLAAIEAAGRHGLVVFLCTLFRQRDLATKHPTDIVDIIATENRDVRIVLLHGAGAMPLSLFEMVRMHPQLILDVSFTIMRYAESSVDQDLRFIFRGLDQRVTVGSDFPEYSPGEAMRRFEMLSEGVPMEKIENIRFRNLERLFEGKRAFAEVAAGTGEKR